jgi:hypothetical protein
MTRSHPIPMFTVITETVSDECGALTNPTRYAIVSIDHCKQDLIIERETRIPESSIQGPPGPT